MAGVSVSIDLDCFEWIGRLVGWLALQFFAVCGAWRIDEYLVLECHFFATLLDRRMEFSQGSWVWVEPHPEPGQRTHAYAGQVTR